MIYLHRPIHDVPHTIGTNQPNGTRHISEAEGNAAYGPYCHLEPGRYFGGFYIRALSKSSDPQAILIDACYNSGGDILARRWFAGNDFFLNLAGLHGITFATSKPVNDLEVRLVFSGRGSFEVSSMVLFNIDES